MVVSGYVYFGTATDPAFYKLTPDGKVRWSYRNPTYKRSRPSSEGRAGGPKAGERFQTSENGVMCSALVHGDSVYFGDLGGWFYALDRATGAERWKISSRAETFPGAHPRQHVLRIADPGRRQAHRRRRHARAGRLSQPVLSRLHRTEAS